jgi:dihydrodipicolinate synthase/N-acetylneuraminate lyase
MQKVMVALITPFTKENEVDYDALTKIVKRLMREGCDGFIVCGTTAETPTLRQNAMQSYSMFYRLYRGIVKCGLAVAETVHVIQFV